MYIQNDDIMKTLINVTGELTRRSDEINTIVKDNYNVDEVLQEDIEDLSLAITNDLINQNDPDYSPLQYQRDYVAQNLKSFVDSQFNLNSNAKQISTERTFKNEKGYLTVGDIRYGNYNNETPIILNNERGEYLASEVNNRYLSQESLENNTELDYSDEKDDTHYINAIYFE